MTQEVVFNCNITNEDKMEVETSFSNGHGLLGFEFRSEDGGRGQIVCLNRSQIGELVRTLEGALAEKEWPR